MSSILLLFSISIIANFENITIEKGMYQGKGSLTDVLEKLDPLTHPLSNEPMLELIFAMHFLRLHLHCFCTRELPAAVLML